VTLSEALLPGFFLLLEIPCLIFPRRVKLFILALDQRFGHVEPPSGFNRAPKYLRRFRLIGVFATLAAMLMVLSDDVAHIVI
jgi:hypothetical protein